MDPLASDLVKVLRRHDPSWTESVGSDPGVTLLEVGAWLAERLDVNAVRSDPYRNFRFRVKWDGLTIAGVTRVSALRRSVEVVEYRDGTSPQLVTRAPGRLVYEPFTLGRPVGTDAAFEDWADQIRDQMSAAAQGTVSKYRKTVRIEVLNQAGHAALAYDVYGCWPSAYQALSDLSTRAGGRLTESLTLVPEGWQRDKTVQP